MFIRAVDQVSSNAAAESGAVVHSSQARARQVDLDDDDNDYDDDVVDDNDDYCYADDDDVVDDDEQLCTFLKHALAR